MTAEFQLPEVQPFVEFLILADRAEALNGKLYMMGGAWDRLWIGDFAQTQTVSLAVGIVVPWSATNEEHRVSVIVSDDDNNEVGSAQFAFRAGASAQMERTESQKVLVAVQMQPKLERPGTYAVRAVVDDDARPERSRRTTFYVKHRTSQQGDMPIS
jgi:hypothetical protein